MEKVLFLNIIERTKEIQLTKSQLHFFFTSNKYVSMSSPRRGGKSFIASMDANYTCTSPNKKVCIVCNHKTEIEIMKQYIREATDSLHEYVSIDTISNDSIRFSNGSEILFRYSSAINGVNRYKFNKVIIMEPDNILNINNKISTLEQCLCMNQDAQLKIIGTHGANSTNLISFMLNPYYDKIQTLHTELPIQMSMRQREELKATMGETIYSIEIENILTPEALNEICEAVTRR